MALGIPILKHFRVENTKFEINFCLKSRNVAKCVPVSEPKADPWCKFCVKKLAICYIYMNTV